MLKSKLRLLLLLLLWETLRDKAKLLHYSKVTQFPAPALSAVSSSQGVLINVPRGLFHREGAL